MQRQFSQTLLVLMTLLLIGCASDAAQVEQDPIAPQEVAKRDVLTVGESVYASNCASCHGADLEGQANWQTPNDDGTFRSPPHDESGHTWHHPDSYLLDRIRNGTQGLDANMQALSNMPAYAEQLTDAEIEAVLTFIKSRWPEAIQVQQAAMNQ